VTDALTGIGTLIRHAVRLDRIRLCAWIAGITFIPVVTYGTFNSLYPTIADRISLSVTLQSNPAFALLLGPAANIGEAGGYTGWRTLMISAGFLGVMSIMTVVRHTRTDEETGRTELLAAGCVGRLAFLAAGVATAGLACLATGGAIAVCLIAAGADPTGAVAYGAAAAATGVVFAAVAAVAVQIATFGRTAISLSVGALALAYLIRAWGDASSFTWLTWLSPLGWSEKVQAFVANNWWTLAISLAVAAALIAIAALLVARRDFGRGILGGHHGPADAHRTLVGTYGLSWRLHRGRLIGWVAGLAAYGAIIGSVTRSISSVISHSAIGQRLLGHGLNVVDLYLAEIINLMGIIAAVVGIQAMVTARTEESEGRVEELLATPLTRERWLSSHLLFALAGSAAVVLTGGLATGLTARSDGVAISIPALLAASLAQIPAVWLMVGLTMALIGLAPRATILAWPIVVLTFLISFFGPLLKLPRLALDLSVFTHVPRLPGGSVDAGPLIALGVIAVALIVAGMIGFRRRSIVS
jgi:ABC-2 type transport system permease protein